MKAKPATLIILLFFVLILAACSGNDSGDTAAPSDLPAEQLEAVDAAQAVLANEIGVDVESIQLVRVEDEEWSDGCLGLGRADESCLAALTPGFRVVFRADGKEYTYRTDQSGIEIRLEMIEE